jgi:hypothetical protein
LSENKFSKYFLYAIGEVFLVVVGILIALQINNWNEGRKATIHEKSVLSKLVEDLKADSASFAANTERLDKIIILHDGLYDVINNKIKGGSLENISMIRGLIWYNPITKENDPFIANKITDESIRREIQNYYRGMKDMDHIYKEFSAVIKSQMRPYLGEQGLYNLNYKFEESEKSNSFVDKKGLLEVVRTTEFQQIFVEAHVKLMELVTKLEILKERNEILKEKINDKLTSENP